MFKLREAGVGGLILKVLQNFLSSRTQRVKVDGVFSSSIDVVSGVPQGSVLGPLLFLLYIADLPRLLQNELVGYADDSTLLCRIPHPRDRSSVAASLNDDLAAISDWCSRWGMLVNPSTRGMLISRSRTVKLLFPDLLIDDSVVEMVSELKILGVCSHFSPVFAWSCCQLSWPIKRWKCQLRSLVHAQSGISECLLQDWQSGWSPCPWSFSSAVCVEETNPWSLGCSLLIFRHS